MTTHNKQGDHVSDLAVQNNPYQSGFRSATRQMYTDRFYQDFATEANRLHAEGTYSIEALRVWTMLSLGKTVSTDQVRTAVALCRSRKLLTRPGYGPRQRRKVRGANKRKGPTPVVVVEPVDTAPFDNGLCTDMVMDQVVRVIYSREPFIPVAHLAPLAHFRSSVDALLKELM